MNNLNSILLEGKLTADPISDVTVKGAPITKFSIECERYVKDAETGELHPDHSTFEIRTFNRHAEVCQEYLNKGRGVRVVGRLKADPTGIFIVAEHVEFKPVRKTA